MGGHWLAELDGRRVTVEVPASSANLGAGYDCLGVALDLTNRVELEVRGWSRGEIELTVDGEGSGELSEDRENRFVRGLEAALVEGRGELPDGVGWRISMHNKIPLARGLGSSAAATVAGVVAANALMGGPLDGDALLRIATTIEGHPDNAAAALLGGFVVSASTPDGVEADPLRCPARAARGPVHPGAAAVDGSDASRPAEERAAGGRRREPRGGRRRRGRPRRRPDGPAGAHDRGSPARAVPGEGLSAAATARRGGPRSGRPRGVPVGCRLHDPRLRRIR